jgi:hypothetical protein
MTEHHTVKSDLRTADVSLMEAPGSPSLTRAPSRLTSGRTSRPTSRPIKRTSALVMFLVLGLLPLVNGKSLFAHAATLGTLISQPLGGFGLATPSGSPVVLQWDSFAANPTNINGSIAPSGGAWQGSANWSAATTGLARATSASPTSWMVLNAGVLNATAEARLSNLATGAHIGIDINDDTGDNLYVLYNRTGNLAGQHTVRFWKYETALGGNVAVSGAVVVPGVPPAALTLRVQSAGSTVTVSVNGAVVTTFTMGAAEIAIKNTGGDNTRFGFWSRNDITTRLDDFHIDSP